MKILVPVFVFGETIEYEGLFQMGHFLKLQGCSKR